MPVLQPLQNRLASIRALLYPLWAGAVILFMARAFYGAMMADTGGEWSAPLDDVFIHFDYARATARGYPFQWTEGNGYSTGNTSITYPFTLALGYWVGFRGTILMLWAAIVACLSVFGYLLSVRRLADDLPRWSAFLFPMSAFSVGALSWSLFSGMEVAWFLAVWGLALVYAWRHRRVPTPDVPMTSWKLGLAGALVVATRPEGASSIAVLGIAAGWMVARRGMGWRTCIGTILRAGIPAIGFLLLQMVVNYVLTGESVANGALVKLAMYNPVMTSDQKWAEYWSVLDYAFWRNVDYHFGPNRILGFIPVALALTGLFGKRTRGASALLLFSAVGFLCMVALNGQVRWQNQRYTQPAVAWILAAAALGVAGLLESGKTVLGKLTHPVRVLVAVAAVGVFAFVQWPKTKEQIWFFARASRNIRDQHVTVGRILKEAGARRILVGDAGAILYAADRPGLDIIGLGGYHRLPFARASMHGVGATLELMERMPSEDWPDVMALYPTWWGVFPLWFGHQVAGVKVQGNVICGGEEKAIYRPDWRLLRTGEAPIRMNADESVTDSLDVADLVSEKEHGYVFPLPMNGHTDMRILEDPTEAGRDVFDAGRRILRPGSERFSLRTQESGAYRLLVRTLSDQTGGVEVWVNGEYRGVISFKEMDGWQEVGLVLGNLTGNTAHEIELKPVGMAVWTNFHAWMIRQGKAVAGGEVGAKGVELVCPQGMSEAG